MKGDEARLLLGFPPDSRPTPSQVKAAYKKKVWESHPDCFPVHEKTHAESKFKLISEAYACLHSGRNRGHLALYGACRRRFSPERRSFIMTWNNSMEMKMMRMRQTMLMQRWGKRDAEVVTLAGVVEPLEVNHAAADATTGDDDDDINFLDDGLANS
ncbi:hypothetical protein L1049_003901 [Liquidambar formosana]|uniref:J domain-containing protein n=1 Tax=Liquidambar formosana TaxID=63359 RepID=A0AAP0RNG5_LIQFO